MGSNRGCCSFVHVIVGKGSKEHLVPKARSTRRERQCLLMALRIHLRVLSVRRLGVTAAVITGTVVCIAVWGGILSHALRKTWALRAILRSSGVARGSRLVPDGRKLGMLRGLTRHANCLSHLPVDRSLAGSGTVVLTLLDVSAVTLLVSLARSLLFLLLCLPFFTDFFELCMVCEVSMIY